MRLSTIFKYLEITGRIELFDWFGIQKPNQHLKYDFIEDCCGYSQATIQIYYTPTDYCSSSVSDLLANQSFCRAWWGEEGLGWWSNSQISFQLLRDQGLKTAFQYMWDTKFCKPKVKPNLVKENTRTSAENNVAIRSKNTILKTVA